MPEDKEELIPEEEKRSRPTSFAKARAVGKMRAIEDISKIEAWADDYQGTLQDAIDAAAEQTEDKGLWGQITTIGATVGCMALDMATGGVCTIAGLVIGAGTRIAVDAADDAETQVPDTAIGPDVDYYRNKIPGIEADLNSSKEKLDNFHANEWKRDVLLQLNDTMTAAKMGAQMKNLGIFKPSSTDAGGETVSMLSGKETSLFDTSLFTEPPTFTS